mgnify:CR=1 FL=1
MTIKATYIGHSAVYLESPSARIIIDPFITGNPSAKAKVLDFKPDFVLVTHDHEDHLGDTEAYLKQGATFVGIHERAVRFGMYKTEGMNIGGSITAGPIRIHMTHALHTCGTGHCTGFVVEMDGRQIHHAGDTGISKDMEFLKEFFRIDLAFVPIGDRYTMGARSAARAVELMGAAKAVPIHYGTWPPIQGEPEEFARLLGAKAEIMKPGSTLNLG